MTILVFGGTGLIGSQVVARLCAEGEQVAVFCRAKPISGLESWADQVDWYQGDVASATAVRNAVTRSGAEAVIHLAAMLQGACELDPAAATRINIDGTVNVLEAAKNCAVRRVVFASSIAVYTGGSGPYDEASPTDANSVYGVMKRLGEVLGARYADLHGIEFVALRYAGVFGPGAVKSAGMALIREQIKSTLSGKPATVQGASGDEQFHFTYVPDAVEATILALRHPRPTHRVYNVAGPDVNFMSLRDFHATIRRIVPDAGEVRFTGRTRGGGRIVTERVRSDLGFVPRYTVEQGLRDELARLSGRTKEVA